MAKALITLPKTEFLYPQFVMVYGTLKQGWANNRSYLSEAVFVGKCITKNKCFKLKEDGVPMVYMENNGCKVKGELYLVDAEDMPALDSLEGHPYWYKRQRVPMEDGTLAWLYIMQEGCGNYPGNLEKTIHPVDGIVEWRADKVQQH